MQLPEILQVEEEGSSLPETAFKVLFFSVFLYTGFLFYLNERYIESVLIFSALFVLAWGLLDSEIF